MRPVRLPHLALILGALLVAAPAAGQVRAFQLTSDNDAYAFWVPMDVRPDWEYTNGIRLAAEVDGAPGWGRMAGRAAECAPETPGCTSTTVEVGHKLFAPRRDSYTPLAGQRHYAGWLYAAATGRVIRGATRHSAGLEVGVTGPASGGQAVMERYHQPRCASCTRRTRWRTGSALRQWDARSRSWTRLRSTPRRG